MKIRIRILITILILPVLCSAQFMQTGIGGRYFYSARWDKMIQTYNFSRPHLNSKQPLLQYGASISFTYWLRASGKLNQGLHSEVTFATSYTENALLNNRINLTLLSLGYGLKIPATQLISNTYLDLFISGEGSLFTRRVNGEPLIVDDKRGSAFGIGCNIQFRLGYLKSINENLSLTPFISGSFSPFHYSPESEAVINQTMGLFDDTGSALYSIQVGIGLQIHSQKSVTP